MAAIAVIVARSLTHAAPAILKFFYDKSIVDRTIPHVMPRIDSAARSIANAGFAEGL